jgi:hypothetical protein
MGAYLHWSPRAGLAQSLYFDAVTEESAELGATATEYPVEEGANVSDHVRTELNRVTLEVFVSNQPIYDWNGRGGVNTKVPLKFAKYKAPFSPTPGAVYAAIGGAVKGAVGALLGNGAKEYNADVLKFPTAFNAVADTLAIFEKLKDEAQLVDIYTSSKTYENMHLEKITAHRNAGTGDGGTFELEWKQIRKVEAKITAAPVATQVRGMPAKPKGNQGAKNAKAETQKKSFAKSLLDNLLR